MKKENRHFPDSLTGHHQIKFSETGYDGKLKIQSLLNLVQDSTMEHSRNKKISIFDLNKKNLTWVMIHFSLHINRRPEFNESITTETFRAPVKGLYDIREFHALDKDNNPLFLAKAAMILINKKSRRPQRLDKHFQDSFFSHNGRIDFSFRKMTACDPYKMIRTFDPLVHDIDYNKHINNTVYSNWAIEAVPPEFRYSHRLKKLEVNFKEESFLEDRISSGLNIIHTPTGISCDHMISQRDTHHTIALAKSVWKK